MESDRRNDNFKTFTVYSVEREIFLFKSIETRLNSSKMRPQTDDLLLV